MDKDVSPAGLYRSLKLPTAQSIRLLEILPGIARNQTKIHLRIVSLDSHPHYEALSYTWGSRSQGKTILVNDKNELPVTNNLFRALRRLQPRFKPRTIWIDAICINQEDTVERGRQVAIMGKIYGDATVVNIWLGETGFVFPICFDVRSYIILFIECVRWLHRPPGLRSIWNILRNHIKAIDIATKGNTSQWPTLHASQWQDRAWVFQEFVLGSKVKIYVGRRSVSYGEKWISDIEATRWFAGRWDVRSYPILWYRYELDRDFFVKMKSFVKLRYVSEYGKRSSCSSGNDARLDVLQASKAIAGSSATDRRDLVYGFLGLIGDEEAGIIGSDYSASCVEVHMKATYASIATRQDFGILGLIDAQKPRPNKLPSWVVNYGDTIYSETSHVALDTSTKFLTLSGAQIDFVVARSSLEERASSYREWDVKQLISLVAHSIQSARTAVSTRKVPQAAANLVKVLHRTFDLDADSQFSNQFEVQCADIRTTSPSIEHFWCDIAPQVFRQWSIGIGGPTGEGSNGAKGLFQPNRDNIFIPKWSKFDVIFATSNGLIGLSSSSIAKDDIIVAIRNSWPFMIRISFADSHTYTIFNTAWIP